MNWKTQDGRSIPVSEMETKHIQNALAQLRRGGYISPKTVSFYVSCPLPQGEVAQDTFDRELDVVLDAPTSPFIDLFEEELEKRKAEVTYQFQCNRCFTVSGRVSRNREDAPTCCGGEPMIAYAIQGHRRIAD